MPVTIALTVGSGLDRPQGRGVEHADVEALWRYLDSPRREADAWVAPGAFRDDYRAADRWLGSSLVGVTHECDYPDFVRSLPQVTRSLMPQAASSGEIDTLVRERLKTDRALYTLDLPELTRLQPDLLVTQALCDVCAVAEAEVNAAACTLPAKSASPASTTPVVPRTR